MDTAVTKQNFVYENVKSSLDLGNARWRRGLESVIILSCV